MNYLSITRLRLHSPFLLPRFLVQNEKAVRQLVRSKGFLQGTLLPEASLAMWTATLWASEEDIRSFYLSGKHKELLPSLSDFACESQVVHMPYDSDRLPSWTWAYEQLSTNGRFSKALKRPSENHIKGFIPAPKFTFLTRPLKPKHGVVLPPHSPAAQ